MVDPRKSPICDLRNEKIIDAAYVVISPTVAKQDLYDKAIEFRSKEQEIKYTKPLKLHDTCWTKTRDAIKRAT